MSLSLALAPFEWTATDGETYKVNLIDTPGYADFAGDVDAALTVADLAVIVVSAVDGVEVGTETAWRQCAAAGHPPARVRQQGGQAARRLPPRARPAARRVRRRASCRSSCRSARRRRSTASPTCSPTRASSTTPDGHHHTEPLPADVADEEHRLHDELVEEIVSGDDEQLERYLSGDVPTAAELERTLAHEVLDGLEFPVLVGSAVTGVGIDRLADFICELGPSPADRPAPSSPAPASDRRRGRRPIPAASRWPTCSGPWPTSSSARCRCSRCCPARSPSTTAWSTPRSAPRSGCTGCSTCAAREHLPTDKVVAGDIGRGRQAHRHADRDDAGAEDSPVRVAAPQPAPARRSALALEPVTQSDDDKLSGALQRLLAEDPALGVDRNEETGQTVLRGVGDTHLAVALERLARKFGVNVETEDVRVPTARRSSARPRPRARSRSSPAATASTPSPTCGSARIERGAGSEFVDSIVGGAIPRNYIPAVAEGHRGGDATGGVARLPGRRRARRVLRRQVPHGRLLRHGVPHGRRTGLKEALHEAGAVVLEPISLVKVIVPEATRATCSATSTPAAAGCSGTTSLGDGQHEIDGDGTDRGDHRYAIELRSMTGGRARSWPSTTTTTCCPLTSTTRSRSP